MVSAAAIDYGLVEGVAPAESLRDIGNVTPFLRRGTARPLVAPSHVPRPRLVQALTEPGGPPVAVLVAPAGYGKTTLLVEWSEHDERPFAWVTLDERDNDPRRLLASARRAIVAVAGRGDPDAPFVLVLDDVHVLHDRAAIAALAAHRQRPAAARRRWRSPRAPQPPLPIARMRAAALRDRARPARARDDQGRGRGADEGRAPRGRARRRRSAPGADGGMAGRPLARVPLPRRPGRGRGSGGSAAPTASSRSTCATRCSPASRRSELDFMLADLRRRHAHGAAVRRAHGRVRARRPRSRPWRAAGCWSRSTAPTSATAITACSSESLRAELHATAPEREQELHRRRRRLASRCRRRRPGDRACAPRRRRRRGGRPRVGATSRRSSPRAGRARPSAGSAASCRARSPSTPTLALTAAGCALLRGQGQMAAHWTAAAAARERARPGAPGRRGGPARRARRRAPGSAARRGRERRRRRPAARCAPLIAGMARHVEGDRDGAAAALEDGARGAAVSAPAVHALCLAELAVLARRRGRLGARRGARDTRARPGRPPRPRRPRRAGARVRRLRAGPGAAAAGSTPRRAISARPCGCSRSSSTSRRPPRRRWRSCSPAPRCG